MVGQIDNGLLALVANELTLILHLKNSLRIVAIALLVDAIVDPCLHSSGEILITVLAEKLKLEGLLAVLLNGLGAIPDLLVPTKLAAMAGIIAVILENLVIPAIQILHKSTLNTVRNTTNGRSKGGNIVLLVELLGRESETDVLSAHVKLLDEGGVGEECGSGLDRHFGFVSDDSISWGKVG